MCIYSNFCPKVGCHGNAPLSLVYGSVTDEFPNGTNPISKPNCAWMCRLQLKLWPFLWFLWPIVAKIWLPWQRPLDPCNQKCLFWIGRPWKPSVISNRILVISRRNGFMCIYSNFVPKLVAMVTPFVRCVRECHRWIPRWHIPYLKTKLCMDMWLTTEVIAIFVIFGLFWPKFGCHSNVP